MQGNTKYCEVKQNLLGENQKYIFPPSVYCVEIENRLLVAYRIHSTTTRMEASFAGKPTAVKTNRVVTAPVAGIPAAPMLDTADVTLQIKHRDSLGGF